MSERWTLNARRVPDGEAELFIRAETGENDSYSWIEFLRPMTIASDELVEIRDFALRYFSETARKHAS